ncbi:TRAP transporter small permease [Arenimonas sp. MALMAid1274]|uniref:TRAP transporter small permease n=1 Tax=Arenimonas sp. MALMAid1274 TaxID=3411630 RepID=UPI003BA2F2D6
MSQGWTRRLHRIEDGLLAGLIAALLLLSVAQIALRLLFDSGLDWAELVSRSGVLWLALIGALGATRSRKHIAIDALPRLLPPLARRLSWIVAQLGAAAVCAAMAWFGIGMIGFELEAPVPFVAGVPSWVPMLIVPAGFGLMAVRFVICAVLPPPPPELPGEGDA